MYMYVFLVCCTVFFSAALCRTVPVFDSSSGQAIQEPFGLHVSFSTTSRFVGLPVVRYEALQQPSGGTGKGEVRRRERGGGDGEGEREEEREGERVRERGRKGGKLTDPCARVCGWVCFEGVDYMAVNEGGLWGFARNKINSSAVLGADRCGGCRTGRSGRSCSTRLEQNFPGTCFVFVLYSKLRSE
jgi:hypothetical protein